MDAVCPLASTHFLSRSFPPESYCCPYCDGGPGYGRSHGDETKRISVPIRLSLNIMVRARGSTAPVGSNTSRAEFHHIMIPADIAIQISPVLGSTSRPMHSQYQGKITDHRKPADLRDSWYCHFQAILSHNGVFESRFFKCSCQSLIPVIR
jgi:hypothetical protein